MTQQVIAIIGAGVVGCLIARQLAASDPQAAITVLDRDGVGAGASRRSAGLHLPRGATPRTRRMSAYSHAYYADLRLRRPQGPSRPGASIHPVGATVISADHRGGRLGGGRLGGGRLGGGRLGGDWLDLAAPVPADGPPGLGPGHPPGPGLPHLGVGLPEGSRAWRIAGCHYADVYQLTQAVAAELRPRVRFLEGVAVTGLAAGGGAVTVRGGTGERIVADCVVLAPGPWLSAPAWRDLLAPLRLRVKRVVALHLEQRPGPDDEAVIFAEEDAFLLPLAARGHWLFSYTSQEWDVDPDALTAGLTAADVSAARDCLRRYSPALAEACSGGRVFCDAYSPDGEPQVHELAGPGQPGRIVFAGAANGSGYRLAPAIGSEVVKLLHPQAGESGGSPPRPAQRSEGVTGDHQYV
jgi:D-arginine dehydrogenase